MNKIRNYSGYIKLLLVQKNKLLKMRLMLKLIKRFGLLSGSRSFLHNLVNGDKTLYDSWIRKVNTYTTEQVESTLNSFQLSPKISFIVPTFNTPKKFLIEMIESLQNQYYTNWELCIADGGSTNHDTLETLKYYQTQLPKIKINFLKTNLHISGNSNEALRLADGEFIAILDHDDTLTPNALLDVVTVINECNADFIYSDEDLQNLKDIYHLPHFKSDYSPDFLLSQNYICHFTVIRRALVEQVGGFETGLDGSQDHDLFLKVLELTNNIHHIPKVLYHWRQSPTSVSRNFKSKSYAWENGRQAIVNAMARRHIKAEVLFGKYPGTYRVKYEIIGNPLISIIIPFKDKPELLLMSINSILEKSTYKNFEIIGVSNNSTDKKTFEVMEQLQSKDQRVKFFEYNVPFNFSAINNHAVKCFAQGEQIILLNNDIEIITPDWIESLLGFSQRKDVGAVGAKLCYPNNTIQHAGVIIGMGGVAGHAFKRFPKQDIAYFVRPHCIQNLSAVTAACLMVKKEYYELVGGLNEVDLKIAFNDVDFCLRLREQGLLNVYTPYCEAHHHESISRGYENTPEKISRFQSEVHYMLTRHQKALKAGDPYYNENLTLDKEDFSGEAFI